MRTITRVVLTLAILLTAASSASSQGNTNPPQQVDLRDQPVQPDQQTASVPNPPPVAASPPAPLPDTNKGMAALQRASDGNRYLFVFFHDKQDQQTDAMWAVFQTAMTKTGPRAESIPINILDPNEKAIVDHFGVSRAPMPLVLAVAPNGAIMGGFPTKFEEAQLLGVFGTAAMEQTMKALQERRLVFVCIQNQSTQQNEAAMYGINELRADPQVGGAVVTVFVNPTDPNEGRFLGHLGVDSTQNVAQTVMLVPPGVPAGKFMGGTTKSMILSKLQSSGGCGPGGCAGGKCGPSPTAASQGQPQPPQQKSGVIAKIKSAFGN